MEIFQPAMLGYQRLILEEVTLNSLGLALFILIMAGQPTHP